MYGLFSFVFLVSFVVGTSYYVSMLIVESQSMDVYRNLAIEEYLMERVVGQGPVLFLWRSECAVVVGKNQNPWQECRLDRMRAEGVPLARRISGGGTVYHDTGNLNYCVIVDRTDYREQQAYDMVMQALEPLGIRAERTGKSNLSVDGLKFSGNAFCFRKNRAMHHGTLLLDTNLERLNRYLGSMLEGIETHAIASVPAQVANLGLAQNVVSTSLVDSFRTLYEGGGVVHWDDGDLEPQALREMRNHNLSDEWLYGATPRFVCHREGMELEVVKGAVVHASGCENVEQIVGGKFADIAFSLVC